MSAKGLHVLAGRGELPVVPVLGSCVIWWRDAAWLEYDTGMVSGLARVSADLSTVDILVMDAAIEGRGYGSAFVDALMQSYRSVVFWQVLSPVLERMLTKRGFVHTRDRIMTDADECMRWDRPA